MLGVALPFAFQVRGMDLPKPAPPGGAFLRTRGRVA